MVNVPNLPDSGPNFLIIMFQESIYREIDDGYLYKGHRKKRMLIHGNLQHYISSALHIIPITQSNKLQLMSDRPVHIGIDKQSRRERRLESAMKKKARNDVWLRQLKTRRNDGR
ncbi:hypothetical protein M8C21_028879 [Ambrosia artemisiifolia]|uniref:Uncharacterized protein n=1 Tax=Ambrosia artemisiifolia TaxID=4212 RepID=A0AAD5C3C2_AMBAR|nr:hypothetical protein M8C21_028879 [Ambrosia artemisiifolia]